MYENKTDVNWKKFISPASLVKRKAAWSFNDFYTGCSQNNHITAAEYVEERVLIKISPAKAQRLKMKCPKTGG
jgi:hypothetical protein